MGKSKRKTRREVGNSREKIDPVLYEEGRKEWHPSTEVGRK